MHEIKQVMFIHRSVGQNLLDDGRLATLIQNKAKQSGVAINFRDINNNRQKSVPGDDTKPADYAQCFAGHGFDDDLVVIKSCYPNNAIKSDEDLEKLKETYKKIVAGYAKRSKGKLLILTTPPLRPSRTNRIEASRARILATWLVDSLPSKRIAVFNFYGLLATPGNGSSANTLKSEYRRLAPWDNHPNKAASRDIAPILASTIVELVG